MYSYSAFVGVSHGRGQANRQSDMLKLIGEVTQILSPDAPKVNNFLTNQTEQDFLELSILTELRKKVSGEEVFDTVSTTALQYIQFPVRSNLCYQFRNTEAFVMTK
jgi:hypothetical protein